MGRLAAALILASTLARAEQWADEPLTQDPPRQSQPRVGFTAGLHVTLTWRNREAPFPGLRSGVRVRLADHLALAVLATWELESYLDIQSSGSLNPSFEAQHSFGHVVQGGARLELFTSSAFRHVFVPELSVGLFATAGFAAQPAGVFPGYVIPLARVGLSGHLVRLQPTGLWFPVFFELGQEFGLGALQNAWYFAVGCGF